MQILLYHEKDFTDGLNRNILLLTVCVIHKTGRFHYEFKTFSFIYQRPLSVNFFFVLFAVTCNLCVIFVFQIVTCSVMFVFRFTCCHEVVIVFAPNGIIPVVGYNIL